MKLWITLGTLISVGLLWYALYEARRLQVSRAHQQLVLRYSVDPSLELPDLAKPRRRAGSLLAKLVDREMLQERFDSFMELTDLKFTPQQALLYVAGFEVILTVLFYSMVGSATMAVFWATVLLLLGGMQLVRGKLKSRRSSFEKALPDFLMMLASSLRAGLSLQRGIEAVSSECDGEVERQLRRASTEIAMGVQPDAALAEVAERMKSQDMQWVVVAIDIQRKVGGNLATVLDLVADTIRGRETIRQEVRAVSSEGRMSANVLVALPIGVFLLLVFTRREYAQVLWITPTGRALLFTTIALISTGMLWIRSMVNME